MANRYLHCGPDFAVVRGSGFSTDTNTFRFDSSYGDHAVSFGNGQYIICDFKDAAGGSDPVVSGETAFVHGRINTNSTSNTGRIVLVQDVSDQPIFALNVASALSIQLQYNSGTLASPAWTNLGSSTSWPQDATGSSISTFDIRFSHNGSGAFTIEFIVNSVQIYSGSFTNANLNTNPANIRFSGYNSNTTYVSEVLATVGIGTLGARVRTDYPNAAGTTSGWTGAYTTVDEPNNNDADFMTSASAGQKTTFNMTSVTLPAGFAFGETFVSMRARSDGGAPANVLPVKRVGGVDTDLSALSVGLGFATFTYRIPALSQADMNSLELGAKSAT